MTADADQTTEPRLRPRRERRLLTDASLVTVGEAARELRVGVPKARELVLGLPAFAGGRATLYEWGAVKARALGTAAPPPSKPSAPVAYTGPRLSLAPTKRTDARTTARS
jgi:hypothetical protein